LFLEWKIVFVEKRDRIRTAAIVTQSKSELLVVVGRPIEQSVSTTDVGRSAHSEGSPGLWLGGRSSRRQKHSAIRTVPL
jgi:hypothetical protein